MTAWRGCSAGPAASCWCSVLVGPYLRKFGAYTVPDFMAFRFGGNFARMSWR